MRSIRVTGSEGLCLVDYIGQSCEIFGHNLQKKNTPFAALKWTTDEHGLDTVAVPVIPRESLKEQLDQLFRYLSGESHILAVDAELIESVSLVEQAEKQVASAHVLPFHDPHAERGV